MCHTLTPGGSVGNNQCYWTLHVVFLSDRNTGNKAGDDIRNGISILLIFPKPLKLINIFKKQLIA